MPIKLVTPQELKSAYKRSGLSAQGFAEAVGLRNRSTLRQLMNGSNPRLKISKKLSIRLMAYLTGFKEVEGVYSAVSLPRGTRIKGKVKECCWCHNPFVGMGEHCNRSHQLKRWRRDRKEKI